MTTNQRIDNEADRAAVERITRFVQLWVRVNTQTNGDHEYAMEVTLDGERAGVSYDDLELIFRIIGRAIPGSTVASLN